MPKLLISTNSKCSFCSEFLPNLLPSKICLLLNKIAKQDRNPTNEDRHSFCEIHYAETTIVSDGIQKGYLTEINFELLESRIIQMKDEFLNIINKKIGSYYWNFSLEICAEPEYYGSKGLNIIVDEVLVPKTALHLIFKDKSNITLEETKKIMEDSRDFKENNNQESDSCELESISKRDINEEKDNSKESDSEEGVNIEKVKI
ncbi:hypothetical protein C1645_828384 [Glomus cerebriforme]|uniref:Restriction of telomere capping protein 4 n=1 Tax=Glomus cerebriforme TaxID=658196 RepID=A0A397SMT8_9GLOM|nr:hypothetical protein C1645_828384 [Glomus cerebriforme]